MAAFSATQQMAALEQLPLEIKLDIMSRLPVESVVRCKCVCRSWRSLLDLNNHHFARLHLQQQQKRITSSGNGFDFILRYNPDKDGVRGPEFEFLEYIHNGRHKTDTYDDNDDEKQVVDVVKDDDDTTLFGNYRVRKVGHPLMIDYNYHDHKIFTWLNYFIAVVGSCDGLVCLGVFGDPTYICNPVTREYINLPRHDQYHNCHSTTTCYIVMGFGQYRPPPRNNTDAEYKVVRIYYEKRSRDCKGQVEVYTVGKDRGRWRNKGQISHALDDTQRGVLVNGTLYWITTMYSMPEFGIVAFDLEKEEFNTVAKIPEEWSYFRRHSRIRELDGCLSLIHVIPPHLTDVWVMKNCTSKNGDEKSSTWVKKFSIPQNWVFYDPFTLRKNGEILAWYSSKNSGREVFLTSYNLKTGNFKQYVDERHAVVIHNTWYGAVPHIKSFISLKDLGEDDARGVGRHAKVKMHVSQEESFIMFELQ